MYALESERGLIGSSSMFSSSSGSSQLGARENKLGETVWHAPFFSRQEAESGQSVMPTWKALLPCQSNLAIYTQGMSKRQLSAPSGKCSGRHQGHVRRDHSSGLGRSHSQQGGGRGVTRAAWSGKLPQGIVVGDQDQDAPPHWTRRLKQLAYVLWGA